MIITMFSHEKFNYKSLGDLKAAIASMELPIECDGEAGYLCRKTSMGKKTAPNAMAILPMEGCDSNGDGSPSMLTKRRYMRFSGGGAGLLWWEACAVTPEGRANPRQMMLTEANSLEFRRLVEECNENAVKINGARPVNILQLTHSGRYSWPDNRVPLIPQHDPYLDADIDKNCAVVTDEYLDSLPEKYVRSALLARESGFDGVDIKACHRYLLSELLASHTRKGRYGGSFENRSRLLLDIVGEVKNAVGEDFIVACRFNVFDAHPYPYGFGCDKEDMWKFDPSEPMKLVKLLVSRGVRLLSNSAGNPYYIYPQVTRPFDSSSLGIPIPEENQLESIARLFMFTEKVQEAAGDIPVVGNGYTWLRQFMPYIGGANLRAGRCRFVGLGRNGFAYPDAPRDIITTGRMEPQKCCITCSKCTQIMRDQGMTGCVIRDSEIYLPLYNKYRAEYSN